MKKRDILKSISDEDERLAAAKAFDKLEIAVKTYKPEFTGFMDPYKAHSIKERISGGECAVVIYGGYDESERVKMGFFPEFCEPCAEDFPITPIEIAYNRQYSRKLSHRDFLGSILGLGITRDKVGDIVIEESRAVAFADSDIAEYICASLERVWHTKVGTRLLKSFTPVQNEVNEKRLTVSSLRLDAVVSGVFNISRGRAAELVKGEKAFVNWRLITSVSHNVCQGDIVTVRGTGRVKINEVLGNTKKDRIALSVWVYK